MDWSTRVPKMLNKNQRKYNPRKNAKITAVLRNQWAWWISRHILSEYPCCHGAEQRLNQIRGILAADNRCLIFGNNSVAERLQFCAPAYWHAKCIGAFPFCSMYSQNLYRALIFAPTALNIFTARLCSSWAAINSGVAPFHPHRMSMSASEAMVDF